MIEGQPYVFHVVPGWILIGTVARIDGENITLHQAQYLESCKQDRAFTELCEARTVADQQAITARSWALPDGTLVRQECITMAWPCRIPWGGNGEEE